MRAAKCKEAIANLDSQGRVHEIVNRNERIREIAREYVRQPENTLVVSPDNESRREINQHIHRAMQDAGRVAGVEHTVRVLNARQELTGADRQWAQNYEPGDIVRYAKSSKAHGFEAGEYARRCARGPGREHGHGGAQERRGSELRSTAAAGRDGLPRGGAYASQRATAYN